MLAKRRNFSVFIVLALIFAACSNAPEKSPGQISAPVKYTREISGYWSYDETGTPPFVGGASTDFNLALLIDCPYSSKSRIRVFVDDDRVAYRLLGDSGYLVYLRILHLNLNRKIEREFSALGHTNKLAKDNYVVLLYNNSKRLDPATMDEEHDAILPDFMKTLEGSGNLLIIVGDRNRQKSPSGSKDVEFVIPLIGSAEMLQKAKGSC